MRLRLTEAQVWDVENLGVRIFVFHQSALSTMRNVLETALLFSPTHTKGCTCFEALASWTGVEAKAAERNVDFLRKYRGIEMKCPTFFYHLLSTHLFKRDLFLGPGRMWSR